MECRCTFFAKLGARFSIGFVIFFSSIFSFGYALGFDVSTINRIMNRPVAESSYGGELLFSSLFLSSLFPI
jgi:hypothetical protein